LDEILRRLGGASQVAELTGRRGRYVFNGREYVYEARNFSASSSSAYTSSLSFMDQNEDEGSEVSLNDDADEGSVGERMCSLDMVNIIEKQKFMNGEKLVAVISGKCYDSLSLYL
jgi:uncharacterized low-complexity protein